MPPESVSASLARRRAKQLFAFLQAYGNLRQQLCAKVADETWSYPLAALPMHDAVVRRLVEGLPDETGPIIRVRRPHVTRPPAPSRTVFSWLDGGWDDPAVEPKWHERRALTDAGPRGAVERFEDDRERVVERERWSSGWRAWAETERPARAALAAYEALFRVKSIIDRESDSLELVFANGWLRIRTPSGAVDYPILIQRAVLGFDPDVPEFSLRDADRDPELNLPALQVVPNIQPQLLAKLREELESNAFHPLGEQDAIAWLRSIIHRLTPKGQLTDDVKAPITEIPQLVDAPVLILRRRSSGVAVAMERTQRAIELGREIPRSLWCVAGVDDRNDPAPWATTTFRPIDALLSKPANDEQVDLIRQLETKGSVLVQGPPGTGKSHTIANLIGHLVATGQRVLVTSNTTKALRVLRDHVVPVLRPLCVSVLENDLEGRKQLEAAINHIQSGIQRPSDRDLEEQDSRLTERRERLAEEIATLRGDLLTVRQSECTHILVGNEQILPLDAAKVVRRDAQAQGWIPGPVEGGAPPPLGVADVNALYGSNATVSAHDEEQLALVLPDLTTLISATQLEEAARIAAGEIATAASSEFRSHPTPGDGKVEAELAARIEQALDLLGALEVWKREVVASSLAGDARLAEWKEFAELLEETAARCRQHRNVLIEAEPVLPGGWRADDAGRVLDAILANTPVGSQVGAFTLLLHPEWKRFIRESKVRGGEPRSPADFQALKARLEVQAARDRLQKRWTAQTTGFSLGGFDTLGPRPEEACESFARDLRAMIGWWHEHVTPLITDAETLGFETARALAATSRGAARDAELERYAAVLRRMAIAFQARAEAERVLAARRVLQSQGERLAESSAQVAHELAEALRDEDLQAWSAARQRVAELTAKRPLLAERRRLLGKVEAAAPTWAAEIRLRRGVHGEGVPPGDAALAWRWRQLEQELTRRSQLDERELAQKLEYAEAQHRTVTTDLVDRRTWRAIRERTGLAQRQALVGWANIMRQVGKGTGKRAPLLLAEARKKLEQARDAVPVWIMPLARVFETINPETTRFDVVIIDEASQCDVTALFALFLGSRVVVVGDHEQVSPDAVGQNLQAVTDLINQHLDGIPNSVLYTGTTSIYDLAKQSFPGQLRLAEHFRCVREIIEFSNQLSYGGEIRPLRESSTALAPHLIEHVVAGRRSANDKTNIPEAEAVVCLMAAAIEQPEYKGKSLGVISLLGGEQAELIDEQVRRRMDAREHQSRRVVCGSAVEFQGDERDVMFLTMVDSPQEGPLALRARDTLKHRYNVAASRARDQLWLVHSLDPLRDLQPDDLRFHLIRHVRDPGLVAAAAANLKAKADSPFEQEVGRRLLHAGYRVRPQVQVGAYHIDLVVIGDDHRVAVECDGERFHPPEQLAADLARQMVLERLGWRFVRLRGSRFYRDPERAMEWLCEQLAERQIRPLGPDGWDGAAASRHGEELVERVRRRAADLRREWFPGDTPDKSAV